MRFKRITFSFPGALLLLFLFSGCSNEIYTAPERPVLYLDIADYDSDSGYDKITDVSIDKTAPVVETVTISNTLMLYSTQGSEYDNMYGGYTFYLEEGASYSQVNYTLGGSSANQTASISNAEAGVVYVVRIYF